MSTKYWIGGAPAVKQIQTISITAFDAATTYKATIGGQTISQVGTTDANTTATNLKNQLAASTHPYFAAVVWTVATNVVTGTAVDAGEPFVATASVTGGTGTISTTVTTANSGPNDWNVATNWSDGVVPVDADDVIIDRGPNICWGLDQNTVDLTTLSVLQTYTGRIGLNKRRLATNADASADTATAVEYRDDYLKISSTKIDLGFNLTSSSAAGSGRIKINNTKAGASDLTVHATGNSSVDTDLPAIRYLANNASANVYIRSAQAGIGIAADSFTETSTLGKVSISDNTEASKVVTGPGLTLTTWEQNGGQNVMQVTSSGVTTVEVNGGQLTTEGDYTITTMNANAGTVRPNNIKTAGNAITTLNIDGGTVDGTKSTRARTWATVNHNTK